MNNKIKRNMGIGIFILHLLLNICSCSEQVEEDPLIDESCVVKIFEKTWIVYPFKESLKAIEFVDSLTNIYRFDVVNFTEENQRTGAFATAEGENFEYLLYNDELDFYLELKLWAHIVGNPCPGGIAFQNFVTIRGPMKDVGVSEEGQSAISIWIKERTNGNVLLQSTDIDSIQINGRGYNFVYESDEEMKIYFTFEEGVVGIVDEESFLSLHLFRNIYE